MSTAIRAWVHLDGWAGRVRFRVTILEVLRKSMRVRFDERAQYGRWLRHESQVGLVPRRSVTLAETRELGKWET